MACFLCRLVCGPRWIAATDRWFGSRWDEPNNEDEIFDRESNQDALRAAYDLRKTDAAEAFQKFVGFAEHGSVWSMHQVGASLLYGLGTPVNHSQAESWLRLAYKSGSAGAMLLLAYAYIRQRRFKEAEALLSGYEETDYCPALYLLGLIYLDTARKRQARFMLEKASALGHRIAKRSLARSCMSGRFGIRAIPHGFALVEQVRKDIEKSGGESASVG